DSSASSNGNHFYNNNIQQQQQQQQSFSVKEEPLHVDDHLKDLNGFLLDHDLMQLNQSTNKTLDTANLSISSILAGTGSGSDHHHSYFPGIQSSDLTKLNQSSMEFGLYY
ncbi:hypothetical protein SAMD00019534_081850, partial [Acytostelium subglobosum LB1]|uniref:hypothetical protein n=1 Tax=Acytostelium subglobosum LB1 TaxID=1410327 RepID=UPI0006450D4B